jgi:membrane-bound lytic murein transglycosylase D
MSRWSLLAARVALVLLAGCAHRLTRAPQRPAPVPFIPGAPEPVAKAETQPERAEPEVAPAVKAPRLARGEVAEADKPEWMRGLVRPDLPLRWYPRVTRWLEMYRSDPRMHEIMRGWLRRVAAHRPVIDEALAREGLPRSLIAVAMIESGLTAGAVSTKAAGGFWQFMPDVARGYGLEVSFWVDERRDLVKSSHAGARYLSDLHHRFGTWELALAGYHAGVFGILQAIVRFNTNDFWTLSQVEAGMPFETTEYVPKVFATAIVERNRAVFGFDPNDGEGPRDADVAVAPPAASFDLLAQRLGIRPEELAQLNPIYLRKRTPPDRGPVQLRIPLGKRAVAAATWPRVGVMDLVPTKVRDGETLARLARARRVPVDRLRRLNGVADDSEVTPGITLLLPRPAGARARQPAKVTVGRR